jgi:hypothetical protein
VTCSTISESACKPGENFINLAAVKGEGEIAELFMPLLT